MVAALSFGGNQEEEVDGTEEDASKTIKDSAEVVGDGEDNLW